MCTSKSKETNSYDYDGSYMSSPTSDSFVAAEMLVGWQWMFDSGPHPVGFAGYFRAGYAF